MIKKTVTPLVLAAALGLSTASGSVSLVGTAPTAYGNTAVADNFSVNGETVTESFTFAAASDSVFAVTLFAFRSDSTPLSPSITLAPGELDIGLTLLDSAISENNGDLQAFLFAANIGTIGAGDLDFTVDWDASSALTAFGSAQAYQLSGATIDGAVTNSSGVKDTPLNLTGLDAGSFAITLLADGNASSSEGTVYGTPTDAGGYNGWGNRGQTWAYYSDVSGDIVTGVDGIAAQVSVSGAFAPAPIPETSTYALLLGFVALGTMLLRRRKA